MLLKTDYTIDEVPHSEHPLPQARRDTWLCLNGKWSFYKLNTNGEQQNDGEIIVPFSPETLLSGVTTQENAFVLQSGEQLVYTRAFTVDDEWLQGKTLLHFGAVDSECEVFVNDEKIGGHKGGFTAFSLDCSAVLKAG